MAHTLFLFRYLASNFQVFQDSAFLVECLVKHQLVESLIFVIVCIRFYRTQVGFTLVARHQVKQFARPMVDMHLHGIHCRVFLLVTVGQPMKIVYPAQKWENDRKRYLIFSSVFAARKRQAAIPGQPILGNLENYNHVVE